MRHPYQAILCRLSQLLLPQSRLVIIRQLLARSLEVCGIDVGRQGKGRAARVVCLVGRKLDADESAVGGEELFETLGPGWTEGGRQRGEELSVMVSPN